jgi:hypothetical protein
VEEGDIKVGQIIKIQRKNENDRDGMDEESLDRELKTRSPVNVLPLKVFPEEEEVSISTFDTDKQEVVMSIPINKQFGRYFL